MTPAITLPERLSSRWATAGDATKLWDFYLSTGFLYPEKIRALCKGSVMAKDHLRTLLGAPSVYRVALTLDHAGEIVSACTAAQFSDIQSWIMHLASNRNRLALLAAISDAGEAAIPFAPRVSYTFTSTNVGVATLFSSLGSHSDAVEHQTYHYFLVTPERGLRNEPRALKSSEGLSLREATHRDLLDLSSQLEADRDQRAALEAVGPCPSAKSVAAISARMRALGLIRERRSVAVIDRGRLSAIGVMDVCPFGWNFSHLGTGLQIFACKGCSERAFSALVDQAAGWFQIHAPLGIWTILVSSTDAAAFEAMGSLGLASTKSYVRIGVPADLGPAILNRYKRRLSLCPAKPEEATLDGAVRLA